MAPSDANYCFYQHGRVSPAAKGWNTFILAIIVGASGSGMCSIVTLRVLRLAGVAVDWGNLAHVAPVVATCALGSAAMYYYGCARLEREYYGRRRADAASWKCKPTKWLAPDRHAEQVRWGVANAAWGSFCGLCVFAYHMHPRTSGTLVKIYFDVGDPRWAPLTSFGGGWPWYFLSAVLCFIYADLWAYFGHRMLHWPVFYRRVHKWHHRYVAVTPFGAYGMHPAEFTFLTVGVQTVVLILPIHLSALMVNLLYIGYHAIIDHSGIDFDGWFPWSPSAMYHDDHHTHFHCNFGQSLVVWDWLCGTLRRTDRRYGAERFHDGIGGAKERVE